MSRLGAWLPLGVIVLLGCAATPANAQTVTVPAPPVHLPVTALPPEQLATRATPRGDPQSWISAKHDYPSTYIRRDDTGIVEALVTVDSRGLVNQCHIANSSGSELLDRQTCSLLKRRARFVPATDLQGQAAPDNWLYRMEWTLGD